MALMGRDDVVISNARGQCSGIYLILEQIVIGIPICGSNVCLQYSEHPLFIITIKHVNISAGFVGGYSSLLINQIMPRL